MRGPVKNRRYTPAGPPHRDPRLDGRKSPARPRRPPGTCVWIGTHECLIAGFVRCSGAPFLLPARVGPTTPKPIGSGNRSSVDGDKHTHSRGTARLLPGCFGRSDTDARKATVRRFGRSDRSAQVIVTGSPENGPSGRARVSCPPRLLQPRRQAAGLRQSRWHHQDLGRDTSLGS